MKNTKGMRNTHHYTKRNEHDCGVKPKILNRIGIACLVLSNVRFESIFNLNLLLSIPSIEVTKWLNPLIGANISWTKELASDLRKRFDEADTFLSYCRAVSKLRRGHETRYSLRYHIVPFLRVIMRSRHNVHEKMLK